MLDYQIKLLEAKIRGVPVTELFGVKKSLNAEQNVLLQGQIKMLKSGYPLDYLLGEIEILGLKLKLNRNVLIPRPETEEWLLEFKNLAKVSKNTVILNSFQNPQQSTTKLEKNKNSLLIDLGCGCGVIGLYLSRFYEQVICVDISSQALEIAKENIELNNINNIELFLSDGLSDSELKGKIEFFCENTLTQAENDFYRLPLDKGLSHSDWGYSFDKKSWTLVANLPYLPIQDKDKQNEHNVKYEPDLALYSGEDGLDLFKKVLCQLEDFETKPQQVVFELDPRNIQKAKNLLENLDYQTNIWSDSGGFERVLIGTLISKSSGEVYEPF